MVLSISDHFTCELICANYTKCVYYAYAFNENGDGVVNFDSLTCLIGTKLDIETGIYIDNPKNFGVWSIQSIN